MPYPRPSTPRQSILILLAAALLFAGGMLAARLHNFAVLPLFAAAVPVAIWGARRPATKG